MSGEGHIDANFSISRSSSDYLTPLGPCKTETQVTGPDGHGLYTAVTILTIRDKDGVEKKFKLTRPGMSAAGKSGTNAIEYVKTVAELLIRNDPATKNVITVGYARIGRGGHTEKVSYDFEGDGAIKLHKPDKPDKTLNVNKFDSTGSKTQFYETLAAIKEAPSTANLPQNLTKPTSEGKTIYEKVKNGDTLSTQDLYTINCFVKSGEKWYEAFGDSSSLYWKASDGTVTPLKKPFPFQDGDSIDLSTVDLNKKIGKWKSKEKAFNTSYTIMKSWNKGTFPSDPASTFKDPLKRKSTLSHPEVSHAKSDKVIQQDARKKVHHLQTYYQAINRETQIFSKLSEGNLSVDELMKIDRQYMLETENMKSRQQVAECLLDICDEATGFDESGAVSYSTIENQLIWDFEQRCWEVSDEHDRPSREIGTLLTGLVSKDEEAFIKLMNKMLVEGTIIMPDTIAKLETLKTKLLDPNTNIGERKRVKSGDHYNRLGVETKDHEKSKNYFEKACKYGCNNAAINLAYMYKDGKGVKQSDEIALAYFWHAFFIDKKFEHVSPFGQSNIDAYQNQITILEEKIASKKDSQVEIDDSVDFEDIIDMYLQQNIEILKQQANNGNAIACYALGYIYYGGDTKPPEEVTKKEAQLAIAFLQKGADSFFPAATLLKTITRNETAKNEFRDAAAQFKSLYKSTQIVQQIDRDQVEPSGPFD